MSKKCQNTVKLDKNILPKTNSKKIHIFEKEFLDIYNDDFLILKKNTYIIQHEYQNLTSMYQDLGKDYVLHENTFSTG